MQKRLTALFLEHHIECFGFLPLDACTLKKPYLLEKSGITSGSVAIFAMPYYTHACDTKKNISSYAVGCDYHLYFKQLAEKLIRELTLEFPKYRFAAFADHSPIDELSSAAMAGLGIIGKHHLLITEKYSSYVFLGEIITDARFDCVPNEIKTCQNCGACQKICPLAKGELLECLSALTQRKGALSGDEEDAIRRHKSLWGCDLCQEVCPHTIAAKQAGTIYTPIVFFEENTLPLLTKEAILHMNEEEFSSRAYAWRGKEVILRNLSLPEGDEKIR